MSGYKLVFEGLQDDSEETLRRVKSIFITDCELSIEQAQKALQEQPFTIKESDSKMSLEDLYSRLKLAGGEVLIVANQETANATSEVEELSFQANPEELLGTELVESAAQIGALSLDDELWGETPAAKEKPEVKLSTGASPSDDLSMDLSFADETLLETEESQSLAGGTETQSPAQQMQVMPDDALSFGDELEEQISGLEITTPAETPAQVAASGAADFDLSFNEDELLQAAEETPAVQPATPAPEAKAAREDSDLSFDLSFSDPEAEQDASADLSMSSDLTETEAAEASTDELNFGDDAPVMEVEQEAGPEVSRASVPKSVTLEPKQTGSMSLSFDEAEEAPEPVSLVKPQAIEAEPQVASSFAFESEESQVALTPLASAEKQPSPQPATVSFETEEAPEAAPQVSKKPAPAALKPAVEAAKVAPKEATPQTEEEEVYYEEEMAEEEDLEVKTKSAQNEVYEIKEVKSSSKRKLPYDLIGAVVVGVGILAFVNMGGEPVTGVDPNELKIAIAKIQKEQKEHEAKLKAAVAAPVISKIEGMNEGPASNIQWTFTLSDQNPVMAELQINMPEQTPLTDEQIVRNEILAPWINKVEIDKLKLEQQADGSYQAQGKARFYMSHDTLRRRNVGNAELKLAWNSDKTRLSGELKAWYGFDGQPDILDPVFIEALENLKYQMFAANMIEYSVETSSPSDPEIEEAQPGGAETESSEVQDSEEVQEVEVQAAEASVE